MFTLFSKASWRCFNWTRSWVNVDFRFEEPCWILKLRDFTIVYSFEKSNLAKQRDCFDRLATVRSFSKFFHCLVYGLFWYRSASCKLSWKITSILGFVIHKLCRKEIIRDNDVRKTTKDVRTKYCLEQFRNASIYLSLFSGLDVQFR